MSPGKDSTHNFTALYSTNDTLPTMTKCSRYGSQELFNITGNLFSQTFVLKVLYTDFCGVDVNVTVKLFSVKICEFIQSQIESYKLNF